MKLDRRYHCFGCGADGDVIDFTAALYGLGKKEAAVQLAQDFGISYEDWKPPGKVKKPKPRQKSPEEQFQEAKSRCFRILADYLHLLRAWRKDYVPHSPEEAVHPRFVEALQKQAQVEYLLDVLLFGETEEKAALITDYGKDVIQLEQRMAELAAADAARTKKHHERYAQNIGSIYELQGLSELHYYLKVEHVFTPAEVEALLSFQDPLDVARWCWEENNHEHSFPICDLLKEIDAEQKFEHFTSEASAQDKYTLLMKRLGQNYFAYRESLMSRDKESLIEKAAEITAMQEAYSYLTTKFEFGDEMLDDVLALENPLKYFADRWLLPVSDVFDVDCVCAYSRCQA